MEVHLKKLQNAYNSSALSNLLQVNEKLIYVFALCLV